MDFGTPDLHKYTLGGWKTGLGKMHAGKVVPPPNPSTHKTK